MRLVLCQRFGDWTCTRTPAWHSECCRPFLACRAAASGVCSSGRVTPAAFATSSEPSRNSRASKTMDGSTQAPLPVPLGGVLPFSILGGLAFPFSELGHSQIGSALSTGSLASSSPCLVPLHATCANHPGPQASGSGALLAVDLPTWAHLGLLTHLHVASGPALRPRAPKPCASPSIVRALFAFLREESYTEPPPPKPSSGEAAAGGCGRKEGPGEGRTERGCPTGQAARCVWQGLSLARVL